MTAITTETPRHPQWGLLLLFCVNVSLAKAANGGSLGNDSYMKREIVKTVAVVS